MRILMAGASGFLGTALAGRLRRDGHELVRLVRREPTTAVERRWDPADRLDPAAVSGFDAVVNLAGSPLGARLGPVQVPARPWTAGYRAVFRASRVGATQTLADAIAAADPRPARFFCASGVSWYGDTGDTETDEDSPGGKGFLAETTQRWEDATQPAAAAGVRVVRLRTGMPLHRDGGLLGPLLLPLRLGLGGRVGDGHQWQPWISLVDWLDAVGFLLDRDDLAGPVNLVGPAPVTNTELMKAIGAALHRPTVIPVPAPVVRVALGEFGRDVLASKRVLPGVLDRAGFRFSHPDLESALRAALA
jgi:uncharacterized protein (TIGR01777 family)